jgi:hypothetical protein
MIWSHVDRKLHQVITPGKSFLKFGAAWAHGALVSGMHVAKSLLLLLRPYFTLYHASSKWGLKRIQ